MEISTPRALLLAVAAIAVLSFMDANIKALSDDVTTVQILFFRQAVAALILGVLVVVKKSRFPTKAQLPGHFLRAMLVGATAFAFFYAIGKLPLVLVTSVFMSAPLMVSVMGVLFLKEEVSKTLIFGTLLGFAGAMVIVFGGGSEDIAPSEDLFAWIATIVAPAAYALGVVVMKNQSRQADAIAITFLQAAFVGICLLPFVFFQFEMPNIDVGARLVGVGFLGAIGFLMFVSALKHLPASVFVLTENTALLWAALFGFVFFAEVPALTTWIGALMIIVACLLAARKQVRRTPKR